MTDEEIFNRMCDMIEELELLSSECYANEYYGSGIELDWIAERVTDTIKLWQKEIQE